MKFTQDGRIEGFTAASAEEAETANYVLCVEYTEPMMFADNVEAPCADCGKRLQHRPDAPKKPLKLCLGCAVDRVRSEGLH